MRTVAAALACALLFSCDPAWHHRIRVTEVPAPGAEGPGKPIAGATISFDCPGMDLSGVHASPSDDSGIAWAGGLGFGLPAQCLVSVAKDGFVPRRWRVGEYCYGNLDGAPMGRGPVCRRATLLAELFTESAQTPAVEPCRWPVFVKVLLPPGRSPFELRQRGCTEPPRGVVELLRDGKLEASLEVGSSRLSPGFAVEEPRQGPLKVGDDWLIDLPLHRKEGGLKGVAVLLYRESTRQLTLAAQAGPYGEAFDYRLVDLDGDGAPELRLRTVPPGSSEPRSFGLRTLNLGKEGVFHEPDWTGSFKEPLESAAAQACPPELGPACDPALDFEVSQFPVPEGSLAFFQGRGPISCPGPCALRVILTPAGGGAARVVVSKPGWRLEAGKEPCLFPEAGSPQPRSCWRQGAMRDGPTPPGAGESPKP